MFAKDSSSDWSDSIRVAAFQKKHDRSGVIWEIREPFPARIKFIAHKIPARINFMLAYANLTAAVSGAETLSHFLRQIPEDFIAEVTAWDFSKLANRVNRVEMTKAAGAASLIVIASSRGLPSIPAYVVNWLRRCRFEPRNSHFSGDFAL